MKESTGRPMDLSR